MVKKFLIFYHSINAPVLNCVNLPYTSLTHHIQAIQHGYKKIDLAFFYFNTNMDDFKEQIPRLQAYIKVLEKEKNIPKEELIFQKERLKKIIDLAKHK